MRVIGIGDSVIDQYPQSNLQYPGGNSANFCVYASMIGYKASYLGVFGNDIQARLIRDSLSAYAIDMSRTRTADRPTNTCIVHLGEGTRYIQDSTEYDLFKENPIILDDADCTYIAQHGLIHTSIYAHIDDQLAKIVNTGGWIAYDFSNKWTEDMLECVCPKIDIGFFSLGERFSGDAKNFLQWIYQLGCRIVIGTSGKKGAVVYNGRRFYYRVPYNLNTAPRNVLGAGDAFLAGFSIGYTQGINSLEGLMDTNFFKLPQQEVEDFEDKLIESSMSLGNALASYVCQLDSAFGHGTSLC